MPKVCRMLVAVLVTFSAGSIAISQELSIAQEKFGTIEGRVTYAANARIPWRLGRYYVRNSRTGELAEAVVALSQRGLKDSSPSRTPATIVVDQKDFQFSPETTAIRAGDQVKFLNNDNHPHNVKTTHPEHSFNVTMPVGGEHVEVFKSAPGILQPFHIDCALHTSMRAWIFVFDHPWYFVTDVDGKFRLTGIPHGEYRLDVVHPAGDMRSRQTVQVVAGKTSHIEVKLEKQSPADNLPNTK